MITEDKGKDDCLPLIFVTGEREGDIIRNLILTPFDREKAGFEYLSELQLYKIVDSENFKIIKILY